MNLKQIKVNPEINISFKESKNFLLIPSLHQEFEIDSETLNILSFFNSEKSQKDIDGFSKEYSEESINEVIQSLIEYKILISDKNEFPYLSKWEDWGQSTWTYHLDTRNVQFALSESEQSETSESVNEVTPPDIYKCSCNNILTVDLPLPKEIKSESLSDVLLKRRTCRNFIDKSISLDDLSTVLFHSAGALFEMETDGYGKVLLKPVPSPGARHSTELYLFAKNVNGLQKGIYHYCVKHHKINYISDTENDFMIRALFNQPYFENASVTFFFTSIVDRVIWKYKTPRVYRLSHFEIGHYCQNILLSGIGLGLGVYQTGSLDDDFIERHLKINGCDEFLMYAAGIGYEDKNATNRDTVKRTIIKSPNGIMPQFPKKYNKFR